MNTSTAKGQIGEKQGTVVWVHHYTGEVQPAPATAVSSPPGWDRIECKTVQEVEMYSRKIAHQEYQKMKSMKVEEHLRSKRKRDEIISSCRMRLAKGCISDADEFANRLILQRMEKAEEKLYKLLTSEPDLSRASFEIEQKELPQILSGSIKRRGLADDEVNPIHKMFESET